MSKKYTFDDWLNGKISNNEVSRLKLQQVMNDDYRESKPYLPVSESKKIHEYQESIFHKAVEITATTKIKKARNRIKEENIRDPKAWLSHEIRKAKTFIAKHPKLEQQYEEYKTDAGSVTAEQAKRIESMYERFISNDDYERYAGFTGQKNGKGVPLQLSKMYVYKIYLNELKKLQRSDNEAGSFNETELQALFNVCQNAKRSDKREILKEYLKLSKSEIKKDIKDLFKEKYQLGSSTFYQWVQALNNEIQSISRTKKSS